MELFDFEWFFCYNGMNRTKSEPSWKPIDYNITQNCGRCDNCNNYDFIMQHCIARGKKLKFCSSKCWEIYLNKLY
jgi:hypothetical protein